MFRYEEKYTIMNQIAEFRHNIDYQIDQLNKKKLPEILNNPINAYIYAIIVHHEFYSLYEDMRMCYLHAISKTYPDFGPPFGNIFPQYNRLPSNNTFEELTKFLQKELQYPSTESYFIIGSLLELKPEFIFIPINNKSYATFYSNLTFHDYLPNKIPKEGMIYKKI